MKILSIKFCAPNITHNVGTKFCVCVFVPLDDIVQIYLYVQKLLKNDIKLNPSQ